MEDTVFKNALLLASYDFYNEIKKLINNPHEYSLKKTKKLHNSFFKYYNRACSRSTPYGLFSSISVINEGYSNSIDNNWVKLNVVFNASLLNKIVNYLSENYKIFCRFKVNSSLIKENFNYIFTRYDDVNNRNVYKNLSIESNDIVDFLFSNKYKIFLYQDLINEICGAFPHYSILDIKKFIDQCIEMKIIINAIEMSGVSDDSNHIIVEEEIKKINLNKSFQNLSNLYSIFRMLDNIDPYSNFESIIKKISSILSDLNIKCSPSRILFVNTYENKPSEIDYKLVKDKALEAIHVLNRFTSLESTDSWFNKFKTIFSRMYGDQMVPFNLVFDPVSGLNYPLNNKKITERDVILPMLSKPHGTNSEIKISVKNKFWFNKYLDCLYTGNDEILITDQDIEGLKEVIPPSSYTFSTMLSVVKNINDDRENPYYVLKNCLAGSASAYLGRFTNSNKDIYELCNKISLFEKNSNPNLIFADISHIPDSKIGDILHHKRVYDYEIPYLINSHANNQFIIEISDLNLGVVDDEFVIYSNKHKKYIHPVLVNAYNFSLNEHPAFLFLCDFQHRKSLYTPNFYVGNWANQVPFFPRVRYKDIIFCPKIWSINLDQAFKKDDLDFFIDNIKINHPNISNHIKIGDSDQLLYIDINDKRCIRTFYNFCKSKHIKGKKYIEVKEYFDSFTPFSNEILLSCKYEK